MSQNVLPDNVEELERFWSQRYESGQTGWDLGAVSPPLKHWIDTWKSECKEDRAVLLPGCGNAYEANYLLDNGFLDVTVVDIAWPAIHQLQQRMSKQSAEHLSHLATVHGDFFDLNHRYSLILEQTFFCALDPSLRQPYVQKMHDLLEPEGELAGVLFDAPMYDHRPPFGGTATEYRELFAPYFDFLIWEACSISHPARQGSELLFRLRKLRS
ncbi:MAG: methyltransferase domain-containing protein [Leptospiraceae bacterium]|nr:methyltransferase domain-containing protein [Leptospiraceae bacterium]